MKLYSLAGLFAAALIFTACDYVKMPISSTNTAIPDSCCDTLSIWNSGTAHKNLLIEEFTGHKCVSCPFAAHMIHQEKAQYGDSIVVVALHPNIDPMNTPAPPGSGSYETDWRTDEAIEYFSLFNLGTTLPRTIISREENGPGNYDHSSFQLTADISSIIGGEASFKLKSQARTVSPNGEIGIYGATIVETLEDFNGSASLVHYLVEDSIVDWQSLSTNSLTYYPNCNGEHDCNEYMHRHILRRAETTHGVELINSQAVQGQEFFHEFFFDDLDPSWNLDHLYIVSYVRQGPSTLGSVLQVLETKVSN